MSFDVNEKEEINDSLVNNFDSKTYGIWLADVMEISLSTVKSLIGNILQKTGLNDRSEFADYLSLS